MVSNKQSPVRVSQCFFLDVPEFIEILLFNQEERQCSPWYFEFVSVYSERLETNG